MITATTFAGLVRRVRAAGYGADIDWARNVGGPKSADEFAREAIFVICNSGMRFTVAQGIFDRVVPAIKRGESARTVFGHPGKAAAIDSIWRDRQRWFDRWMAESTTVDQKLTLCEEMPWIGGITKYHLAKNFGAQVAKPDVHLQRLADLEGASPQALCERLADETGLSVIAVDVVLWRASALGILDSRTGQLKAAA